MHKPTGDFAKLGAPGTKAEGSGGHQTSGDETGARAERLAELRTFQRSGGGCTMQDRDFLLAELDRVTATLESFRSSNLRILQNERDAWKERDAARASRNAWAEKCAELERARAEALDLMSNASLRASRMQDQRDYAEAALAARGLKP
jgi:hypothetical protein